MPSSSTSTTSFSSRSIFASVVLATMFSLRASCHAEEVIPPSPPAAETLPDAPSALAMPAGESSSLAVPSSDAAAQFGLWGSRKPVLAPYIKFVRVGQTAPRQTVRDKFLLGARESVTPFAGLGWSFSAGWSHLINSSPNYGTNSEAFAQRFGAAAALSTSKEIFSDSVLASVFHQDPRYYQLGRGHKLARRAIYAASRPIIGRTDGGRTIPNYATILGTGGAAALTHTYYPERNVTPGQVVQTWSTSLGGSAVGYLVSEFGGDILSWLHVTKHE